MYEVVFINERGQRVTKRFNSPYQARLFANKLKYSKRCKLVFAPLFN